MTKIELLKLLDGLVMLDDPEDAHSQADDALLEYINDPAITEAFGNIDKWYA